MATKSTGTKIKTYVNQLPPYQQRVLLAARTIFDTGVLVTPDTLAEEIEGDMSPPVINKINQAIQGLTGKGCWMFTKGGKLLPGDFSYIGWPDGTAGPTATTTRTTGGRTTTGTEADRQTEREFVHTIQAGYAELPFETQKRVKEAVRTLEDLVMQGQR